MGLEIEITLRWQGSCWHAERLQEYGIDIFVNDGTLMGRAIALNEEYSDEDVFAITAPESQEFLNLCNEALGTEFRMEDFAGR